MNFEEYQAFCKAIIDKANEEQQPPYDNELYINYARLNWTRTNRWLKTAHLSEEFVAVLKKIESPQQWTVITEPWCSDAAHIVPFIHLAALQNPLISVTFELRDAEPHRINDYLFRGTKAIPRLIIQNADDGTDLGTWGPRPQVCQVIYDKLVADNAGFDEKIEVLQKWYNADKGKEIQKELAELLAQ